MKGGSTLLLLFEPGVMRFDPDMVDNSKNAIETLVSPPHPSCLSSTGHSLHIPTTHHNPSPSTTLHHSITAHHRSHHSIYQRPSPYSPYHHEP